MSRVIYKVISKKDLELSTSLSYVKHEVEVKKKVYDESDPFIKVKDENIAKYLLSKNYKPTIFAIDKFIRQDNWAILRQIDIFYPELGSYILRMSFLSSNKKTFKYFTSLGLKLPHNLLTNIQDEKYLSIYKEKPKVNVVPTIIKKMLKDL
jgi:hypothetical protein